MSFSAYSLSYTRENPHAIPEPSFDPTLRHFLNVCTHARTRRSGKPREITADHAIEVLNLANLYNIEPLKRVCTGAPLHAKPIASWQDDSPSLPILTINHG